MTSRSIRVLVADGLPLFRDSLARAIRQDSRFQLVADTEDGPNALAAIERHRPDVMIVDADLPGISGMRILRAVRRDELDTKIVLVVGDGSRTGPYAALQGGATGWLSRRVREEVVRDAVRRAATGDVTLCEHGVATLARELRLREPDEVSPLSPRERQVLALVADGATAPEIAGRLGLAARTVRTHLEHLFEKLCVNDRAQLVAVAMRRGLLE